jgi:hypothetical protein
VRYKDGVEGLAVDDEGDDLPDAGALRAHVVDTARHLMSHSRISGIDWRDCTFEVTDEAGARVLTVPFAEA